MQFHKKTSLAHGNVLEPEYDEHHPIAFPVQKSQDMHSAHRMMELIDRNHLDGCESALQSDQ